MSLIITMFFSQLFRLLPQRDLHGVCSLLLPILLTTELSTSIFRLTSIYASPNFSLSLFLSLSVSVCLCICLCFCPVCSLSVCHHTVSPIDRYVTDDGSAL